MLKGLSFCLSFYVLLLIWTLGRNRHLWNPLGFQVLSFCPFATIPVSDGGGERDE